VAQRLAPEWTKDDDAHHTPHSRSNILDAFSSYLTVSHLWAALVHGQEAGDESISPADGAKLPGFLAYAESFAEHAARTPWLGPHRRVVLPLRRRWRFALPEALREIRLAGPRTLDAGQQAIVDTLPTGKSMN